MASGFSTKARTLAGLDGLLRTAHIAPQVCIGLARWHQARAQSLAEVPSRLGSGPWIVRSSCKDEDSHQGSRAGAYLSLLDVACDELDQAIDRVFASYGDADPQQEVLIQPMLRGVVRAGVAFSHDPNTCAPYRVINWSEGSDTTAVTTGTGGQVWQQAAHSPRPAPEEVGPVLALLDELLLRFSGQPLDCEFAVTAGTAGQPMLWLLQVRPLLLREVPDEAAEQARRLALIAEKVAQGMRVSPFLLGQRTVYGVMPDWNPAEIIGIRPKPLALSLYRELVTDSIWAYQRHNYGYRNLRSVPLMPNFAGLPYIDVRVSFNSFIPADLDEGLAGRLVDYYIQRLIAAPQLHDKVEFEVVFSCYTLDLPRRLECLAEAGFSEAEREAIAQSLRRLTNRIIHPREGLWRSDAAKLDVLEARRKKLEASAAQPVERIYWLLEDAKRYGTLPFAGLARAGFVAVQMLKSLVAVGVFSAADYDAFVRSLSTVSGQLARDRVALDPSLFLARYGHLRPGTYDILSPRYDEAPAQYFDWSERQSAPEPPAPFAFTLPQMREIARLLEAHGLECDPVGLFDFLQAGIELRELAKFHFTRNLSDALVLIGELGASLGLSREALAYCDISAVQELYMGSDDPRECLERSIAAGRRRYEQTLRTTLPALITQPEDVWGFMQAAHQPNFITQKQVTAPVTSVLERGELAGRIVCIPNADPGFDWLFACPIAGLITTWGGANSHMAIRAGELGLPAVIGAGEASFQRWQQAQRLFVDCAGQRVEVLA